MEQKFDILKVKSSAIKIEKMIRNEVPTNLHSQENIKKWIKNNWGESKFKFKKII
ncbi:hypothetical protein [Flavobacterium sp.]|uniref:hypothetical protein n=1 Tax=Flavobacterium sp. TaxID=239 RepID=UPI0037C04CEE